MKYLPPELLSEMTLYILYPNKNFPNIFSSSWLLKEFLIPHVTKRKEILKKRRNELERLYNGARQEPIWLCIVSSTGPEKQKQTIDNFLFYLEEYLNYPISNRPTVEEEKELSDRFLLLVKFFYHCEETIAWKYLKTTTSRTVQQFLDELSSFFALVFDLSPEHSQHQQQSDHQTVSTDQTNSATSDPRPLPVVTESVLRQQFLEKAAALDVASLINSSEVSEPARAMIIQLDALLKLAVELLLSTVSADSDPRPLPVVTESVPEESTYDPPWDARPLRFIKTMAALEAHRSTNISDIVARLTAVVDANELTRLPPDVVGHLDAAVTHLEASAQRLNLGGGQSANTPKISKFRKFIATLKTKKK